MIWCLLDQLLREWMIQTQVSLSYFPPLQKKALATRLSTILETFFLLVLVPASRGSLKRSLSNSVFSNTPKNVFSFISIFGQVVSTPGNSLWQNNYPCPKTAILTQSYLCHRKAQSLQLKTGLAAIWQIFSYPEKFMNNLNGAMERVNDVIKLIFRGRRLN